MRRGAPTAREMTAVRRRGPGRATSPATDAARWSMALTAPIVTAVAVGAMGCAACSHRGGVKDAGADTREASLGEDEGVTPGDWVRLGTGFDEFVPLSDGDTVELEAGCQGGHHLWASIEAREPGTLRSPLVAVSCVRVRDGAVVSHPFEVRVSFEPVVGTDVQRVLGLQIVATELDAIRDEEIDFRVRVTTRDGRIGEHAVRVRAVLGPVTCGAERG